MVAKYLNYDKAIKPGKYKIDDGMSLINLIRMLRSGNQTPVKLVITKLRTKEDLAKYINSFSEVIKANKILVGPHLVARGSQKNHKAFVDFNLPSEIDNIYFEDIIAKSILFRSAEKVYGIKPNAIGDLRFITVPYAISYLVYSLKIPINLYKIWKNDKFSSNFIYCYC